MDLKAAKRTVHEMIDLCSQLEDPTLNESTEGIYHDVTAAKSIESVISSARELMIFISEVPDDDDQMLDIKSEIDTLFNTFMEDYGDF